MMFVRKKQKGQKQQSEEDRGALPLNLKQF